MCACVCASSFLFFFFLNGRQPWVRAASSLIPPVDSERQKEAMERCLPPVHRLSLPLRSPFDRSLHCKRTHAHTNVRARTHTHFGPLKIVTIVTASRTAQWEGMRRGAGGSRSCGRMRAAETSACLRHPSAVLSLPLSARILSHQQCEWYVCTRARTNTCTRAHTHALTRSSDMRFDPGWRWRQQRPSLCSLLSSHAEVAVKRSAKQSDEPFWALLTRSLSLMLRRESCERFFKKKKINS